MHPVKRNDLLNQREFVIDEYLEIIISEQVQIDLVTIVTNGHYESALLVKQPDLVIQRQLLKFCTSDHI